jgi:signal peptidase I
MPISNRPDSSQIGLRRAVSAASQVSHSILIEVLDTVLPAFVIAVLINLFLAQGTYVHGQSMEPNLHSDQRLIIEKVSYRLHAPRRGDIVVLRLDQFEIPLIKRVVGLPGEMVEIHDNQVFIDGEPLREGYLPGAVQRNYGPMQVPPDHVFVMGDNRDASNDSRSFGAVQLSHIVGRAWLSYWPPEDIRLFE